MIVPGTPGLPSAGTTSSPMTAQQPSDTNLLMAAAEMHRMGKFDQPEKMPKPKGSRRPK